MLLRLVGVKGWNTDVIGLSNQNALDSNISQQLRTYHTRAVPKMVTLKHVYLSPIFRMVLLELFKRLISYIWLFPQDNFNCGIHNTHLSIQLSTLVRFFFFSCS